MNQKKNVYIAGAGKFGIFVLKMFEEYGKTDWNVLGFLDNDKDKQGRRLEGKPVVSIVSGLQDNKAENVHVFIGVKDLKAKWKLASQLTGSGYLHVYYIENIAYEKKLSFFQGDGLDFQYVWKIRIADDGKAILRLPYLETHVMDGCNLKCKGCTHFSNLFPTDAAVPLENFRRDIVRLREICDIKKLRLLGGEPLLNKELLKYIKIARDNFPDSDIRIVTNGMLLLQQKDELLSYMREYEIMFDISWYPPTLQRREEIVDFLDKKGIKYYAPLEEIHEFTRCLTMSDSHNPFVSQERCGNVHCTVLRDGKLYRCPLAAYLPEYKKRFQIDIMEDSGLDIYHEDMDKIREFLVERLLRKPIEMCRYCAEQPESYLWESSPEPQAEEWLVE